MPRVEGRVRRSRCPGRSFPDTSSFRAASMLGRDETESGHSENKPTAFQGCAYCPARRGYHWLLWTAWLFWERLWTKRYLKELPSRGTVPPIALWIGSSMMTRRWLIRLYPH